jgi:hypothetical protein
VHTSSDSVTRDENPRDDSLQDMVERFLLGERRLLEKEVEGEPVVGHRAPTRGKFALVDYLEQEHRASMMRPEQFEARLAEAANNGQRDQREQAVEMLDRWEEFKLLGQAVPRRDDPYASRPDPGRGENDPRARDGG